MNRRMILSTVGTLLMIESVLLLLPSLVAVIYRESCLSAYLITAFAAFVLGFIIRKISRPRTKIIFAKEGFVIVGLTWVILSAVGAVPFVLSGDIPHYYDAFFEMVSGFTTTGASIVPDVTALSHATLFWRSFSHWIGGMGILVFMAAVLPSISERPIHILKAEMPGPIMGKFVPKLKETAIILYLIYIALTVTEFILLLCGNMSVFEALIYSMGTAGTGGFAMHADGLASFSAYSQWVITVFMLLFGVNFNLYYLIIIKRFKETLLCTEVKVYFGIVIAAVTAITINISHMYSTFSETVRTSAFQVASIVSTTGYTTTDFNNWPDFSKAVILLLMISGACAGSTAGGFKISRIIIIFKLVGKEIKQLIHPRSVSAIRFEGKNLDNATLKSVSNYCLMYFICLFFIFLIISLEPFGLETNLSATFSCFNNIGPGLSLVGPMANYSIYSVFSKYLLSFAMILGRLEIFPVIIMLSPTVWSKNK